MRNRGASGLFGLLALGPVGCTLVYVTIGFLIGGWAVQFALFGLFGVSVPFVAAGVAGLIPVIGQLAIPIAVILWLVSLGGMALPVFALLFS